MMDTFALKLTTAAVFVLAGAAGGRWQAGRLAERVKRLEELIGGMRLFQSEIYYTHERLETVAGRLASACQGCASRLFLRFAEELAGGENRDTEELWSGAVSRALGKDTPLKPADLETLKSAGVRLGKDDIRGQCSYIEKTIKELEVRLGEARQDCGARSPLFRTLGIAAGCAGAVLIF